MDTSLSPSLTAIAAIGVFVAVALFITAFRLRHWKRIVLVVVSLSIFAPSAFFVAALNAWLTDARYRTYRSFYYDIEVGMTRAEVLNLVDKHYPVSASRSRPNVMDDTNERLGFFMNPEYSKEPNCEGIFLSLHEGRVAKKVYSPD